MFFSAKWRSMVATDSLFSRTRRFKRSSFATSSASPTVATPVPDNLERRFAQLIARDDVIVVLAGEVGFAYLTLRPSPYYDGPVAMLEELYVAPAHRGHGLGTQMMERVLSELEARGAGEMQINVDEVDAGARRFYERHGFTNIEAGSRMLLYIREL